MPQTRLGRTLATVAAAVAVVTAVGSCVQTWRAAMSAKQIANDAADEPRALRAYGALSKQVEDLKTETKQLRDAQMKMAGYFEAYLKARGATELPSKELSVPDVATPASAAPPPPRPQPRPMASASSKPFAHPPSLFILPPVPRPKPQGPEVSEAPPAPAELGWE